MEYNRYGIGSRTSKELQDVCVQCPKTSGPISQIECPQYKELHKHKDHGAWGKILIDMVFHVRGIQDANIFCLEVKPYDTNRPLACDQFRVKQLIQGEDSANHRPCYRYGVAMNFDSDHSARYHLYYLKDGELKEEKELILH